MKKQKEKEELKDLSVEELKIKVESLRKELFTLHLNIVTTHIKDYSQFPKLRRGVARALTYLRQKESKNTK
ncbi:50S ribosomal protein L29 [bacterium]|nr:50S ribosomal protein L29 [bacterium]